MIRCLYLSYDGLLDPLGRSQIVPYLKRLPKAGVKLTVLSFEKAGHTPGEVRREFRRLREQGIRWFPLRYHKRPPVLSTLWDLFRGLVVVAWISLRDKPELVHARSYVAALLALWARRRAKAKFLFDIRGFWPEERVESGTWKAEGLLYRVAKGWERRFFSAADGVVVLSRAGKQILESRFAQWGIRTPNVVIPTCVDLRRFTLPTVSHPGNGIPSRLAYVGSASRWYLIPEMAQFFSIFRQRFPQAQWVILTYPADAVKGLKKNLADLDPHSYRVEVYPHEKVPELLQGAKASLCFVKPVSSRKAGCPTKVGESLACGVPVVVTQGVGDLDELILKERVGVLLSSLDPNSLACAVDQLKELWNEGPELSRRCRRVAEESFDLEKGVKRYLALYRQMVNQSWKPAL